MAVKIGSARIDENGKATGGKAGDQTGNELSTQNWYKHSKGWRILRCNDPAKAELIATAMEAACANNNIGYDQAQRLTLYNKAKSVGFDPAKVTDKCETDCSALVRVCLAYAGISTDNFITSNEAKTILATGLFTELTDSKYTDDSSYLKRGDILVTKTKGHTVVVLSNGNKATTNAAKSADAKQGNTKAETVTTEKETTAKTDTTTADAGKTKVAITASNGGRVNIRCGNGMQYSVIKIARNGTKFDYVATAANGWNAIVVGDQVGWVSGKYSTIR